MEVRHIIIIIWGKLYRNQTVTRPPCTLVPQRLFFDARHRIRLVLWIVRKACLWWYGNQHEIHLDKQKQANKQSLILGFSLTDFEPFWFCRYVSWQNSLRTVVRRRILDQFSICIWRMKRNHSTRSPGKVYSVLALPRSLIRTAPTLPSRFFCLLSESWIKGLPFPPFPSMLIVERCVRLCLKRLFLRRKKFCSHEFMRYQ